MDEKRDDGIAPAGDALGGSESHAPAGKDDRGRLIAELGRLIGRMLHGHGRPEEKKFGRRGRGVG